MVRSSYKNRKKNRKQSFKRRITGGNRDVNFIEDDNKMVGGNPETITRFINKYTEHPIYGVLLAIYSNQKCAVENDDGTCFTWWFVIVSGIMLTSQCSDEREGEDYYVEISEDNILPSLKEGNPKYTTVGRVKMLIDVLKGEE